MSTAIEMVNQLLAMAKVPAQRSVQASEAMEMVHQLLEMAKVPGQW